MTVSFCSVRGCGRQAVCRGWCQKHYMRWTRTGSTDDPVRWHGTFRGYDAGCRCEPCATHGGHGASRYTNHKCRCVICTDAWREAHRAYMQGPVQRARHAARQRAYLAREREANR